MTQAWLGTYNVVWTAAGLPEEKKREGKQKETYIKKGRMKERGRNERKMVQGWKGGAGLTEGGLESQSVERWKRTDDGKWAGELGTRKAVWGYSQAYGWDRKPGEGRS